MEHGLNVGHERDGVLAEAYQDSHQAVGEVGALQYLAVEGHAAVLGGAVEHYPGLVFVGIDDRMVWQVPDLAVVSPQLCSSHWRGISLTQEVFYPLGVLGMELGVSGQFTPQAVEPSRGHLLGVWQPRCRLPEGYGQLIVAALELGSFFPSLQDIAILY